jgi:2-phosphosulfolactate phosphatase
MRVGLYVTPDQSDEFSLRDQTVVVVDVLRAGTSIAMALANGAKEIIPVTTVERAVKISGSLFGDHILRGGERHGKMIEGFNLGNSPLEYTEERVKGKAIIFSTTNGSRAIDKARFAREVAICAFVNISAVARFLSSLKRDFHVICSGNDGLFSMEDTVCAGMLVHKLGERKDLSLVLSDGASAALALFKSFGRSSTKMIKGSEHGQYLAQIGFADDLDVCASVDLLDVVPQLFGNVIKLKQGTEKAEPLKNPVPAR